VLWSNRPTVPTSWCGTDRAHGRRRTRLPSLNPDSPEEDAMMYEVQTFTLCQGWVNCWSVEIDGISQP